MSLKFTQKQIELGISEILEEADIAEMSRISGIGYSYLQQQLNPNESRKSYIYGALLIMCALDEVSLEKGEALSQLINKKRELSKPVQSPVVECLNNATAELNREISEYVSARISNKPFSEQMKEFLDIEAQLGRVKKALVDEYNRLHESGQNRNADLKIVK